LVRDKYIGDAIMGFWNAPLDVPDHELRACAAALDMIDRLEALNLERERETRPGQPFLPFRIGIGINTGRCVVGNIGSDLRFSPCSAASSSPAVAAFKTCASSGRRCCTVIEAAIGKAH
jgi:class 3 adenylate cyclase